MSTWPKYIGTQSKQSGTTEITQVDGKSSPSYKNRGRHNKTVPYYDSYTCICIVTVKTIAIYIDIGNSVVVLGGDVDSSSASLYYYYRLSALLVDGVSVSEWYDVARSEMN